MWVVTISFTPLDSTWFLISKFYLLIITLILIVSVDFVIKMVTNQPLWTDTYVCINTFMFFKKHHVI